MGRSGKRLLVFLLLLLISVASVTTAEAKIKLSKKSVKLYVGSSVTLKLKGAKKKVTWSSTKVKVAKVTKKGKVTALKKGTAKIKAKSAGKTYTCKVTVINPFLNKTSLTLDKGKSETLTLTGTKIKSASSSNAKVAAAEKSGKITAVGKGSCTITFTGKNKKKYTCKVTVTDKAGDAAKAAEEAKKAEEARQAEEAKKRVAGISLNQTAITLSAGSTTELKATVTPATAENKQVRWSSSNTSVATVTSDGQVEAKESGTAVITAASAENASIKATCTVTVPDTVARVSTQNELVDALDNPEIRTLYIESDAAATFEIPEGTHTNVTLIVKTPNAEVINNALFAQIVIKEIAADTFVENAIGNHIIYEAETGKIEISEDAQAVIEVSGDGSQSLILVDNSSSVRTSQVILDTAADLVITGSNSNRILVDAGAQAGESTIESSKQVDLSAQSKVYLTLDAGAENTSVTVDTEENIPEVNGLGRISVTNEETNEETFIVAKGSGTVTGGSLTVKGNVSEAGAIAYLIPYNSAVTNENAAEYLNDAVSAEVSADDNIFAIEGVAHGNYLLVIVKEGFQTAIQTVIITSSTTDEGTFLCENVTLIAEVEEDNETGSISGIIVDSLTGSQVEYPVKLNLRKGLNNMSGDAVQVVTAEDGTYEFTGLAAGSYTIQAQSAESNAAISSNAVSTALQADTQITEQITVTRTLQLDQVQFVLHWLDKADNVPADLDSHLVGPNPDGTRFHTWYSHKAAYYNDEKMADLDVDDVDYTGPETTTIYQNVSGVYSFYVYDFTNQSNETSNLMSDYSGAYVEILGTVNEKVQIPTGKTGNLWHVADYDSARNRMTIVNTVGYWPDGGSSTVGMTESEMLKDTLNSRIETLEELIESLMANAYKEKAQSVLDTAKSVSAGSDDTEELTASINDTAACISEIESAFYISSVTGDNISDYSINGNLIALMGDGAVNDITITAANEDDQEVFVEMLDESGENYQRAAVITNTVSGVARKYLLAFRLDPSQYFDIANVTGENVIRYSRSIGWKSGSLYVYGLNISMPELTITPAGDDVQVSEISYEQVYDGEYEEYEEYENTAYVTFTRGSDTYRYWIYYYRDLSSLFEIESVTGEGVLSYSVDNGSSGGDLTIYGTADSLPELTVTPKSADVTASEVQYDEYEDPYVILTQGEESYRYWIIYEKSSLRSVFAIDDIYDEDDSLHGYNMDFDTGVLELVGSTDEMPAFTITFDEDYGSVTVSEVKTAEDGSRYIEMQCGALTYVCDVKYRKYDQEEVAISEVAGEGLNRYETSNYWREGQLYLYGSVKEMPAIAVTPLNTDAAVSEVKYTEDGEAYIEMTLAYGTYRYWITWYYEPDPESTAVDLELGESLEVTIDSENPYVWLRYAPEETGTYILTASDTDFDNYVELYEAGAFDDQIAYDDDGAENGNNFRLSYELESGKTYYYKARPYSSGNTGNFTVTFTKYEEEAEETEAETVFEESSVEETETVIEESSEEAAEAQEEAAVSSVLPAEETEEVETQPAEEVKSAEKSLETEVEMEVPETEFSEADAEAESAEETEAIAEE